jgi:hypothetical protein
MQIAGFKTMGRLGALAAMGLALWAMGGTSGLARTPVKPSPAAMAPQAQAELKAYLGRLTVLTPEQHGGLTLYPIAAPKDFPLSHVATLDEALKRKALVVTELEGSAQVNALLFENVSASPIFVMAGEILRGAKQDRTMQNDLLIPPKSGKLKVSVFCTEHGRWAENAKSVESAEQSVPNSVRRSAKVDKTQRRVWSSIEKNQDKLRAAAPTAAAKDVYEAPHVKTDLKPFLDRLSGLPARHAHVVGVVAAYGDRLVAVDVFGDDDLFARLYPKLLRSYVVDVLNDKPNGAYSAKDAASLLAAARAGEWVHHGTEGMGAALALSQKRMHGSALLNAAMTIHADVFTGEAAPPAREDWRAAPNVQQRRDRQ